MSTTRCPEALDPWCRECPHVVTEFPQPGDGHQWDVLVNQDVHPSIAGDLNWGDLLFGERGGIVEASQDVLAGQGRIFTQ